MKHVQISHGIRAHSEGITYQVYMVRYPIYTTLSVQGLGDAICPFHVDASLFRTHIMYIDKPASVRKTNEPNNSVLP